MNHRNKYTKALHYNFSNSQDRFLIVLADRLSVGKQGIFFHRFTADSLKQIKPYVRDMVDNFAFCNVLYRYVNTDTMTFQCKQVANYANKKRFTNDLPTLGDLHNTVKNGHWEFEQTVSEIYNAMRNQTDYKREFNLMLDVAKDSPVPSGKVDINNLMTNYADIDRLVKIINQISGKEFRTTSVWITSVNKLLLQYDYSRTFKSIIAKSKELKKRGSGHLIAPNFLLGRCFDSIYNEYKEQ